MNRPRYETEQDLAAEEFIGSEFAKAFNGSLRKLPDPPRYSLDCGVFRDGKMIAIIEVKSRSRWRPEFRDVILGLSKVRELFVCGLMGIPAYFVVCLPHGGSRRIIYAQIDHRIEDWHITWGGRTDRNDSQDVEPVVHIPIGAFRELPNRSDQ